MILQLQLTHRLSGTITVPSMGIYIILIYVTRVPTFRQVTRGKAKNGAVVKHQRKLVVLKTTSNKKGHFKSGFVPLCHSSVTSLNIRTSNCQCNI